MTINLRHGMPEPLRQAAAHLYLDAFAAKLRPILGQDRRAAAFLADVIRPEHAIVALDEGGRLRGLAGLHDSGGGFVGGEHGDLARHYGLIGGTWRALALSMFERAPAPGQLLLDGIAVAQADRGQGVGAALLRAVAAHARAGGLESVRLDVVDTNPRARALYERMGYIAQSTTRAWPVGMVFGFGASTTMILPADTPASGNTAP